MTEEPSNNRIEEVIKRRKTMFEFLHAQDPALSVAEEVSVPDFRIKLKEQGIRSIHLLMHTTARASLQIPQLRLRVKVQDNSEDMVAIDADNLYCSYAVQNPDTDINHCSVLFDHDLAAFAARAQQQEPMAQQAKEILPPTPDPSQINAVNLSVIPWLRLNSLSPSSSAPPIPLFTIGKFIPAGDRLTFTLCALVNHRLVDAFHVHQFIEQFRANISEYVG